MSAVFQSGHNHIERKDSTKKFRKSLYLLRGSFSSRKVSRQSPVLAGLHKATDGGLVGVLMAASLMSFVALHYQHMWTVAF